MRAIGTLFGVIRSAAAKPLVFSLFALAALGAPATAPDILNWPDCPPGASYGNQTIPRPAHFQTSPVAGPSGGTCSLDVVTGSVFDTGANSAGGVTFSTAGELSGVTYTLAFDFQWVSGEDEWTLVNEDGDGKINGLSLNLPYPGDRCWHHYEFTAPVGPVGAKGTLFVYQGRTKDGALPVLEEMRIDNMTLREVSSSARSGLVVEDPEGERFRCWDRRWWN